MSIYNIIQNLFKIKNNPMSSNTIDSKNYLLFSFDDPHKNPSIKIHIEDLSDTSSQVMSTLLFNLNEGLYKENIINVLLEISKKDLDIDAFMRTVIIQWNQMIVDNEKKYLTLIKEASDKPYISPRDFNKYAK